MSYVSRGAVVYWRGLASRLAREGKDVGCGEKECLDASMLERGRVQSMERKRIRSFNAEKR